VACLFLGDAAVTADRETKTRNKIAASSQLTLVLERIRHRYANNAAKQTSLTRGSVLSASLV
jgi:hypothetical protein